MYPAVICILCVLLSATLGFDSTNEEIRISPYSGNAYQGDILLRDNEDINDRAAMSTLRKRWPNKTIYYVYQSNYGAAQKAVINAAIAEFHKLTCIRFVEGRGQGNYIYIENSAGCYSFVGMSGGAQKVNLLHPGCIYKNTVVHEFLHALGFWHEQSRPDRDNYVNINWNNIDKNFHYAYDKMSASTVNSLGEPYDVYSVMHYDAWAFALNRNQPAISPKDKSIPLAALGRGGNNGRSFTDSDLRGLNKLYGC